MTHWSLLGSQADRFVTTSSTRSHVQNGPMAHPVGPHGTQSFSKSLKTANPNGFGCHANPYVAPTNDHVGSGTNRVNFVAPTQIAYGHTHPIGSMQNSGPFVGGYNMNSTQVWPQATHSTVTWSVCPLAQPTWLWPPCHTLTKPITTSSDGMHRSHSLKPTATWSSLLPADEPTSTMNNLAEAELRHHADTTHPSGMSLHQDQLSSEPKLLQLQHQPHIPNHGFPKKPTGKRTPGQEQNENMPNNKKLELRQKLHRHLLLTRHKSYQLVHQWHPPSTRHANIGLTRPRSQEPLRLSARQPAPQSRAYQPVSQNLHQLQYPTSSTRLPHKQTLTPWHSHGTWSVVSRLHLPHQESQTQFWEHGSKDHRSNSPASCPQHICKACRPSCVKTAVFNWTVNSSPSSHPCFRTTTQSVWAHGAPSYRATWSHRSPAINILIAFSWSPWHPKHRQQTPPSSSFGGTNISCLPGTWHKNGSPIAVRGQLSYPNTYKPFFWRPSTLWNWPDQWDHLLNFANRRALLWPP